MLMTKIFIDPRTRVSYASFYIQGLYELYGKQQVQFDMAYFKSLKQTSAENDFDQYFAFVVVTGGAVLKRIIIDFRDKDSISNNALVWCNVYGKINLNRQAKDFQNATTEQQKKIEAIGPNFGIRIWSDFGTVALLVKNYLKCFRYLPVSFRVFLAGYNWQLKRSPLHHYTISRSTQGYVFFISSLYKEAHNNIVNSYRAKFIRACKSTGVNFEGGLLARPNHPGFEDYKDVITDTYVESKEYIEKIKQSAVVFNTPAVWNCHGWKLGEYLAMGKAIISTPLINEMPFNFGDDKHICIVHSEKDIQQAVEKITANDEYRTRLESNAKTYYSNFLSPEKVVKRLIEKNAVEAL